MSQDSEIKWERGIGDELKVSDIAEGIEIETYADAEGVITWSLTYEQAEQLMEWLADRLNR